MVRLKMVIWSGDRESLLGMFDILKISIINTPSSVPLTWILATVVPLK